MAVVIERLDELPPEGVGPLVSESEQAGLGFVRRLAEEWASGRNRFDRPGEALFAATLDGRMIGVCGLNIDPYAPGPKVGRVRHLYVLVRHRHLGVAASWSARSSASRATHSRSSGCAPTIQPRPGSTSGWGSVGAMGRPIART